MMKLVIGNCCKRKPVILGEVSRRFKLRMFSDPVRTIINVLNFCSSLGFSLMISKVIKLIQSNLNLAYFANVLLYNEALK